MLPWPWGGGPVLLTAHRGTVTGRHTSLSSLPPVNLKNGEIVVLFVEQNVLECGVPRAMPPRTAATGNTPARERFCNHKSVNPPKSRFASGCLGRCVLGL